MRESARTALDACWAEGASYADIRIIRSRREDLTLRNGVLGSVNKSETLGFGIRAIVKDSWGFAASSELNTEELKKTAALACETARASSMLMTEPVRLADEPVHDTVWGTPYIIDPFKVSVEEKLGFLSRIDAVLRKNPRIKVAESTMRFWNERQWLATTDGTFIDQNLMRSAAGYSATAVESGEMQRRSYPSSHGGLAMTMGYELVKGSDLLENAERIRDEAVALLSAPALPSGKRDIILDPSQLALQIHESAGHPTELDRVLGSEANYAGMSFLTLDKLNELKYGSDMVNLVIDGTIPGGLATVGFDDDGVRAGRYYLVRNGLFVGYMTNRELAHVAREECSRGCNRADGYENLPMVRQNNLCLLPNKGSFEELLADSPGAVYMVNNKSWSIDQLRVNFQFGCEVAWEVTRGGKLGQMYKNPNYQGLTTEFWNSCDFICGPEEWVLLGVTNCGKGQPGQGAEMSHGCAPSRFRGVTVGIGN
jgi:TldD protein